MQVKVTDFEASEFLTDEATIAEYLAAVLEEGDEGLLLRAIGDIAKAKGVSTIARRSGLGRESLYKALSADAKPRFTTILRVLHALGIRIAFCPASIGALPTAPRLPRGVVRRVGKPTPSRVRRHTVSVKATYAGRDA